MIKLRKKIESIILASILSMAQQSLCPDTYEKFIYAYNELIYIRKLPNKKIDYSCRTAKDKGLRDD